jgi:HSP20 family molecular chaperone IbpA
MATPSSESRPERVRQAFALPPRQSNSRSLRRRSSELVRSNCVILPQAPPVPQVTETSAEYRIVVPIGGMDLRNIYVVAEPRSILIETRIRESRIHDSTDPIYSEETHSGPRESCIYAIQSTVAQRPSASSATRFKSPRRRRRRQKKSHGLS